MTASSSKQFSIGIDDFKNLVQKGYYYVDKTLFIKDIIDYQTAATLILRPRRFGKTLNLSTVKYFFDLKQKDENLFERFAIWHAGEKYRKEFAKYPVIFISLKEIKAKTWEDALFGIKALFAKLYRQFDYLLESSALSQAEKNRFNAILNQQGNLIDYTQSLADLSQHLSNHRQQNTILLIDEYDTPFHQSLENHYINDMLKFMGPFLDCALKSNPYLHFGVITGILKISKENL